MESSLVDRGKGRSTPTSAGSNRSASGAWKIGRQVVAQAATQSQGDLLRGMGIERRRGVAQTTASTFHLDSITYRGESGELSINRVAAVSSRILSRSCDTHPFVRMPLTFDNRDPSAHDIRRLPNRRVQPLCIDGNPRTTRRAQSVHAFRCDTRHRIPFRGTFGTCCKFQRLLCIYPRQVPVHRRRWCGNLLIARNQ
jgi:hypothetical protein